MKGGTFSFDDTFSSLTGYTPLSWQRRLFTEHFAAVDAADPEGDALPQALDIPTGLGKTSVMAVWLAARAHPDEVVRRRIPRRLVYVVDRRAVVDQATAEAQKIRKNLEDFNSLKRQLGLEKTLLPISTLRGQHVDNRDWLADPTMPAIIIGTVDMIGSRLLFSGYGISSKMRPYHAGFLGADTLVVLDEAHLVPPFEALIKVIVSDSALGPSAVAERKILPPFRLMSLSATGRTAEEAGGRRVFRLKPEDHKDDIVRVRLGAPKRLNVEVLADAKALVPELAKQAWRLGTERQAARVLVYCNSRQAALDVRKSICVLAKKRPIAIELLVGARRVRERDRLFGWLQQHRFVSRPKDAAADKSEGDVQPTFLIATSAGEVGVDLDADHMVCDLVEWERMVQRFGRVNRLGAKKASIEVIAAPSKDKKRKDEEEWSQRLERLRVPLDALRGDASPGAVVALKDQAEKDRVLDGKLKAATTPPPLRPALSRALVDAWSMTSLEEHTGRPDIQPWLRGWVDDEPQTRVVWRKHLPVRRTGGSATPQEVNDFFEAAPPHTTELLETETRSIVDWLVKRAAALMKTQETATGEDAVRADRGAVVMVMDSKNQLKRVAGRWLQWTLAALAELDENKKGRETFETELRGCTIVVSAALGGLDKDGMLDDSCDDEAHAIDTEGVEANGSDVAVAWSARPFTVRETDNPKRIVQNGWKQTYRFAVEKSDDGSATRWLVVYERSHQAASEDTRALSPSEQLLTIHRDAVVRNVQRFAEAIGLSAGYVNALCIAARLHDEGKALWRWQRAFNAPRDGAIYAKTRGPLNTKLLDGYRHEFGSLWKVEKDPVFLALDPAAQDLVLHLVTAHHGFGRPVIPSRNCEETGPEEMACNVVLRFARLQKRWGPWGLAWWESLLRAADQQASRENDGQNAGEVGSLPNSAEEVE